MGRTNYAILAMGLASMLVLSLLMQQFLHKADEKRVGPLVPELSATFGGRLDRESKVVLEKARPERGESSAQQGVRARVTIYPMMGISVSKLAQEIGDYVWRRIGDEKQLTGVLVICRSLTDEEPQEFEIPRPYMTTGRRASRAGPAAGEGAKKSSPAKPNAPAPDRGGR